MDPSAKTRSGSIPSAAAERAATATASVGELVMTIDGEPVPGTKKRKVINPARGVAFTEVPDCSRDELDTAMEAAQRAFPEWSGDVERRREGLTAAAEAVKRNLEDLAPLLTLEQGKPLGKAAREIHGMAAWLTYTAGLEIPVEVVQDDDKRRAEIHRKPLGVVAAITPWNYPVLMTAWKLGPALLAGNTVVLKPSPYTPVATLKLGEILSEVFPPGVFNVVSGGDDLGAWMTEHPVTRKISLTGSIETGKKVAMAAAPDLKRVTLELGGNDAAILLPDLDAEAVAEKIFWGAFENTGQVCSAIKRVYVPEAQYAGFVERIAEIARGTRMGDGLDEDTELGPINNEPQLRRVMDLVEKARKAGAKIVTGGESKGDGGYFYAPTIVSEIGDDEPLVAEEQFGPALPILPYADLDDAVERANATRYGLSGSVWSDDPEEGARVAARLQCGTAWVNQHIAVVPHLPFGGMKWSGIGVEHGPWGLLGFTELQVVNVAKGGLPKA